LLRKGGPPNLDDIGGKELVDRRLFLSGAAAGAALSGSALAGELAVEPWMKTPGSPFVAYGQPSRFEDKIVRIGALDQLGIKREGLRCAP
jgi:sulfane dehydrogenase subunit SoxC